MSESKNFRKLVDLWYNYTEARKLAIPWKIPVIIILRQGFLFLNSKAMHKMLFSISLGVSLLITLVPQWIMTYLRWFGRGNCSTRQRICWVRSPPMPRFSNSLKKVSQTLLQREGSAVIESPMIMESKWLYVNRCTWFLWSSRQYIFCGRFVGVADKYFRKPCFNNKLSNIANLNNFSSGSPNIKL